MDVESLIKQYLSQGKMMQVATSSADQPWVCTVYYVEDEFKNLYWLSLPTTRHSREIAMNPKIAVAIPIKFDKPVIGLQAEGSAEIVSDASIIVAVMYSYTERYDAGRDFYDNFIAGKNQHLLYKFTPKKFNLFDETNFAKNDIQSWEVKPTSSS
jgi:uncharacterized protein YhbP (UPF0306 family)